MLTRARSIRLSLAAAALLLALLGILATLQYRWIGQVGDAERDRARAAALSAAQAAASDVDRELGRAVRDFGLRPPGAGVNEERDLADAVRRSATRAHLPELVNGVFRARSADGGPELRRYDPASSRFEDAAWPADLSEVRAALASESIGDGRPGGPPPRPSNFFAAPPALVVADASRPPSPGGEGPPPPRSWTILALDRRILDEIVASAIAHHFGDPSAYDVAVVGPESNAVFYRSRSGFDPTGARIEAAAPILRPRPPEREFGEESPGGPRHTYTADATITDAGPPGSAPPPGSPGRDDWQIVVAHRAGSLDAAVASTRRRNLAVSAGILALLAATIAVLIVSAHRDRRLAAQQVEFVAGLTHELRTPLAAVRSAAQNLADGIVDDPERVRSYGALVHRESQRLSMLIEDALARAGITARRGPAPRTAVRVEEVIAEAVDACGPIARQRDASVVRDVAPDLPPVVGDRDSMRTLFENLVSNAIKYGGEPARVTVRVARAERDVAVDVQDNGAGIPKREIPRIFEPFYRGSGASERAAGTGVGLALVRRIVEEHGGRITVESGAGGGATFRVILPAAGGAP